MNDYIDLGCSPDYFIGNRLLLELANYTLYGEVARF